MRYHNITKDDMKNGDGLRVVLWLAGCEHHCPGCQNPITWNPEDGLEFNDTAKKEIFDQLDKDYISGITFSGGDPLHPANINGVLELIEEIRSKYPDKTIWLYTGYTWEQLFDSDNNPCSKRGEVVQNVDVYQKAPVYNFEMHRSLYGKGHDERWVEYYSDIKNRLLSDQPEGNCGYHMSDEDFYIYITSHAYKHYSGNGTGIRTLLDFYAYLNAKEESLDLDYIKAECRKLGISDFEKRNRRLCRKVFSSQQIYDRVAFEQSLSADEMEMLKHYLSSGVYGTLERMVENRMEKMKKTDGRGKLSKLTYYWHRVFPVMELYEKYPLLVKHKWLIPAYWFYRIVRMLFSKKRRNNMLREVKTVKKVTAQESFNEQSASGY